MQLYCMDFRDYTTLRNTHDMLRIDGDILDGMCKVRPNQDLEWCRNKVKRAARNLDIILENLYVKDFKELK